jgi:hypothetical protein
MNGTRFHRWLFVFCSVLVVCGLCAPTARADCPPPTNRFGVDLVSKFGRIIDYDVAALHIGWYSDWSASAAPLRPGDIDYVQVIWISQGTWCVGGSCGDYGALNNVVDARHGAVWIIGNEPECPHEPGGGKMTPQQYGAVYHDLYTYIKTRDPSAQIAIGGVVEPTPLRLEWLDLLLTYYQTTYGVAMPVDIWTTHLLILPEKRDEWGCGIPVGLTVDEGRLYVEEDCDDVGIFEQLVLEFRVWLRDRGQRNKPLWLTEYGVLLSVDYGDITVESVNAFMNGSFDYMLNTSDANLGYPADSNLLVQRWAWNSLNDQPFNYSGDGKGFNGGLFEHVGTAFPGTPTAYGLNFINYTNSLLTGTACINGTVSMEARPAAPDASYVTIATLTLLNADCPRPDVRSITTNTSGGFTVCNVQPGTYGIAIKSWNTLSSLKSGVVLSAGSTNVNLGPLPSGDINNDNRVNITDYSLLAAAYRTVTGDAAYNALADFNKDGRVDLRDFSVLASHYSQVGNPAW